MCNRKGVEKMANLRGKINKLLYALKMKGRIIKLETKQFYSEEKNMMITQFILDEIDSSKIYLVSQLRSMKNKYKKTLDEELFKRINEFEAEIKELYVYEEKFYSQVQLLIYLSNFYKKVGVNK